MNDPTHQFDTLLQRSRALRNAIGDALSTAHGLAADDDRTRTSAVLCNLAMEHADAVLTLLASGMPTSAVAVLRIQYESLTRAIWAHYAATPGQLSAVLAELTSDGKTLGPHPPMLAEMLNQLDGVAPTVAVESLRRFQTQNWRALNSYVHAGAHAFRRHHEGMPLPMVLALIRHSNGMLLMAGMMLAILTGDADVSRPFAQLQERFEDCLPATTA